MNHSNMFHHLRKSKRFMKDSRQTKNKPFSTMTNQRLQDDTQPSVDLKFFVCGSQ